MTTEKTGSELTVVGTRGVQVSTLPEMIEFAKMVATSGLAPASLDTPEKVLVATQTGMELGFTMMRSLQAVVVVKGKTTLMGEAALALIRASNLLEPGTDIELGTRKIEGKDGDDAIEGWCRSRRRGGQWQESTFSFADAKRAGLYPPTKFDYKAQKNVTIQDSPWMKYPKRMLMWRAVSFHVRDFWSDVTHGLRLTEEMDDTAYDRDRKAAGRTRDVTPTTPSPGTRTGAGRDPLLGAVEPLEVEIEDVHEEEPDWLLEADEDASHPEG